MTTSKDKIIEVLGQERRRRWSVEEKLAMVRESLDKVSRCGALAIDGSAQTARREGQPRRGGHEQHPQVLGWIRVPLRGRRKTTGNLRLGALQARPLVGRAHMAAVATVFAT